MTDQQQSPEALGRNPPDLSEDCSRAEVATAAFRGAEFPLTVQSRYGQVVFEAVSLDASGDTPCLDVRLVAGVGDPHIRIFNPPLLAEDPSGHALCGGVRYRYDPITAVAELIALHRGGLG